MKRPKEIIELEVAPALTPALSPRRGGTICRCVGNSRGLEFCCGVQETATKIAECFEVRRFSATLFGIKRSLGSLALVALFLNGCKRGMPDAIEKIPVVFAITNGSPLQKYESEFSNIQTPDKVEPLPLPLAHVVEGTIDWRDHNTNCALWVVGSHKGETWGVDQKLYYYAEKTGMAKEITAFKNHRRMGAKVLADEGCAQPYILTVITATDWWDGMLWKYFIQTGELKRVTPCSDFLVSPDRSMVIVVKMGGDGGFYSYHIWDVKNDKIIPIISCWEADEGSGGSWSYKWSEDSKAFAIHGLSGGFSRDQQRGKGEFNFIYLVAEDKMFSTEKKLPYYADTRN